MCAQELAESDSLEEGPLLDGATFHNLARQCRLEPRWHEQVSLQTLSPETSSRWHELVGEHLPHLASCWFHPLCKRCMHSCRSTSQDCHHDPWGQLHPRLQRAGLLCFHGVAASSGTRQRSDGGAWAQVTMLCKLGMTKGELRRLAASHARFFSFSARATRPKLLLLRTEVCLHMPFAALLSAHQAQNIAASQPIVCCVS